MVYGIKGIKIHFIYMRNNLTGSWNNLSGYFNYSFIETI